jgi:hypothetical protein
MDHLFLEYIEKVLVLEQEKEKLGNSVRNSEFTREILNLYKSTEIADNLRELLLVEKRKELDEFLTRVEEKEKEFERKVEEMLKGTEGKVREINETIKELTKSYAKKINEFTS